MKIFILFLNLLLFSACEIVQDKTTVSQKAEKAPITISDSTTITKSYVETGGMYNRNYELIIRGTGEIILKNNCKHQKVAEQEQWQISRDDLFPLIDEFQNIDFLNLENEYGTLAIDSSITTISINFDAQKKTVKRLSWSKNTPEEQALRKLEILINKTANAEAHIRKACYSHNEPPLDYPSESLG